MSWAVVLDTNVGDHSSVAGERGGSLWGEFALVPGNSDCMHAENISKHQETGRKTGKKITMQ